MLISQWFAKIEQQQDKWQVPLEKTRYPQEIEAFWRTYKEAKDILDTVHVRPETASGPDQDVKRARDELGRLKRWLMMRRIHYEEVHGEYGASVEGV